MVHVPPTIFNTLSCCRLPTLAQIRPYPAIVTQRAHVMDWDRRHFSGTYRWMMEIKVTGRTLLMFFYSF